jgi:hypothetical protein
MLRAVYFGYGTEGFDSKAKERDMCASHIEIGSLRGHTASLEH